MKFADRLVSLVTTVSKARPKTKADVVEEFRIQSIQDAAMRVIAKKGFADATMQDIADAAGISKGTVYLYFQSREELVERTVDRVQDELLTHLDDAVARQSTLAGRIESIVRAHVAFFDERQDFFRVYLGTVDTVGDRCARRGTRHRKFTERLTDVFRDAIAAKEMRKVDVDRIAIFVSATLRDLLFQRINDKPSRPAEDDIRLVVGFILGGLQSERK